jgi:hypothetical protein
MTTWFVVFSFTRSGCSCQALSWPGQPSSRCVMLQPKSRPAKSQASTCFPVALTLTRVPISSGQARKLPKRCVFGIGSLLRRAVSFFTLRLVAQAWSDGVPVCQKVWDWNSSGISRQSMSMVVCVVGIRDYEKRYERA